MNTNAGIVPVEAVKPVADKPQTPIELPTPKALADIEAAAHYRLLIEEGPRKGSFVYKTLNSLTGEIVRQFPREQLVKLAENDGYNAGSVIKTRA
jgi:flagellar protein FlaG